MRHNNKGKNRKNAVAVTDKMQEYPQLKTTCPNSAMKSWKTANTLHSEGILSALIELSGILVHPNTTGMSTLQQKTSPMWRSKHENLRGLPSSVIPGLVLVKRKLNWMLMGEGYSAHLTIEEQRRTLRQAFRMWSEVTPLIFREVSPTSPLSADITLGFGTGRHFGCPQAFESEGNELAHSTSYGEIHFNDDQHFTASGQHGISLLKVAVHEIGHVLGLPHSTRADSVMSPSYNTEESSLELGIGDRRDIQRLYGARVWIHNSEESKDPYGPKSTQLIQERFPGITGPIDAAYFSYTQKTIYFFTGSMVTVFDIKTHRPLGGYPQRITDMFPSVTPSDHPIGNLDAVYYSFTHQALFFFKGVYFWKVVGSKERSQNASLPINGVLPRRRVSEQWFDICDITSA
ncbi:matrix metalloproteinase-21-like isoform X3 [Hyla sarda]|uniref:matrix metalloproteinase-21-like isoform X3 n=1 Tax=Hyla sarda TaxID=327740 RepID=UPI0024C33FC4|nr:matrix metalloproteinase-21-like isoform X3 [Hyla sarda]